MNDIRIPQVESQSSGGGGDSFDAGRLMQALWRGKWFFLFLPLIFGGGMYYWLKQQRPLYRSTAQVLIEPREVNPLKGEGGAGNKARTVLKQQQTLVKSPAILKTLSEMEEIKGLKSFSKRVIGTKPLITELNDRLGTVIDPNTDRLSIAYMSPFPDEAAKIARTTVDVYIEYHKKKKHQSAEESASILRKELETYLEKRDELSGKIIRLRTENNITASGETFVQSRLDDMREAWNKAHLEMIDQKSVLDALTEAEKDVGKFLEYGRYRRSTKQNPNLESDLQDVEQSLLDREIELQNKLRDLGEGHDRIKNLRVEISALRARKHEILLQYARNYKKDTEIAFSQAFGREQGLEKDVASLQEQIHDTNSVLQEIENYQAEYDSIQDVTDLFKSRLTELDVENQAGALNIEVLDYGRPNSTAAWPDHVSSMMYAITGGFGLAFAFVLLRSFGDRRIRSVEEVPGLLNLSVVGVFPRIAGPNVRSRIGRIVEEHAGSVAAEAIRNLRTATTFALPKSGKGVILVTSSVSGEGKSISASNLAFALATGGRRTLLVDGDMRKPRQHRIYNVDNDLGLGHVMTRAATAGKCIVQNVAAGLDLLPAGDPFGKPSEIFESRDFPELIEFLRRKYDCIVIDAPPVLESSEARVMASEVDLTVFVMRIGISTAPLAQRAMGILRAVDARVLGAFLNGARKKKRGSYTGGISYGYGYGEAVGAPEFRSHAMRASDAVSAVRRPDQEG